MKLDLVALQNAVNAQLETLANQEAEDQEEAMQAAIPAYCEKAGVVMVRDYVAQSAAALLMGLSVYWEDQGDSKQAAHVENIACRIVAASQEEE